MEIIAAGLLLGLVYVFPASDARRRRTTRLRREREARNRAKLDNGG